MSKGKFKIEDINIGDEVYFESTPSQSNFGEYWKVTGKKGNELYIEVIYLGRRYYWTIDITQVHLLIKL